MAIGLICLDADDTLWHNMRYFDAAERALLETLQPFADGSIAPERLHAVSARNLALYGYGAKSFTLSMIEAAMDICGGRLPVSAVNEIISIGRGLLRHPVELLPGVTDTLKTLAGRAQAVLVTKGDLLHQEVKLAASGLAEHFAAVEIVSEKTPDAFRRLFARHGIDGQQCVVAGDSILSDILPALEAGAWAAFVPHDIVWFHERGEAPTKHPRFRRLRTITELPPWIDEITSASDNVSTSRAGVPSASSSRLHRQ